MGATSMSCSDINDADQSAYQHNLINSIDVYYIKTFEFKAINSPFSSEMIAKLERTHSTE